MSAREPAIDWSRDVCAACRKPMRLRMDGRVKKHRPPRPSDSGWSWRENQRQADCPGSGEPPLPVTREVSA